VASSQVEVGPREESRLKQFRLVALMPFGITVALVICMVLVEILLVLDWATEGGVRRLLIGTGCLLATALILHLLTGFPTADGRRQAFGGGVSDEQMLALMFLGVVAGIAAHYAFYARGRFSWRSFARPLVVSPIVLLPLIGSVQGAALETIQIFSFVILAFQNGFFWREVLRNAKP
jgi:hypothetical protein